MDAFGNYADTDGVYSIFLLWGAAMRFGRIRRTWGSPMLRIRLAFTRYGWFACAARE